MVRDATRKSSGGRGERDVNIRNARRRKKQKTRWKPATTPSRRRRGGKEVPATTAIDETDEEEMAVEFGRHLCAHTRFFAHTLAARTGEGKRARVGVGGVHTFWGFP